MRSLLLAAALAAPLSFPVAAWAQAQPVLAVPLDGTRLEVVGTGEVTRTPDLVMINAGVTTQAPTASEAIRQNARQMESMRAALRRAGVADRDIQTSSINLHPQWHHGERRAPEFQGYQATNQVSVRFRDVAEAGPILDALVEAGANNVNGPMFALSEPEEALEEARLLALRDARERAERYARALGMRIVKIVAVSETGGGFRPGPVMTMAARAESADTRIEAGEQSVNANLTVTFELR